MMVKRVISVIFDIVFIIAAVILLISGISCVRTGSFSIFGYRIVYIASESMEPTISKGSLIITKDVVYDDDISIDDIAGYRSKDGTHIIIHRIIGINNDGNYIFKGDNNQNEDKDFVEFDRIKYKYIKTITKSCDNIYIWDALR